MGAEQYEREHRVVSRFCGYASAAHSKTGSQREEIRDMTSERSAAPIETVPEIKPHIGMADMEFA